MTKWFIPGLLALGLTGCVGTPTAIVDRSELGPVPRDYRATIAAWARDFFAEPESLRSLAISEPVPARDGTGTLLWLVCLDADARAVDGRYLGPKRFAFGFTKAGAFSAPLQRTGARVAAEDCDRLPLAWQPFSLTARR